jgi:hypothetical protein
MEMKTYNEYSVIYDNPSKGVRFVLANKQQKQTISILKVQSYFMSWQTINQATKHHKG